MRKRHFLLKNVVLFFFFSSFNTCYNIFESLLRQIRTLGAASSQKEKTFFFFFCLLLEKNTCGFEIPVKIPAHQSHLCFAPLDSLTASPSPSPFPLPSAAGCGEPGGSGCPQPLGAPSGAAGPGRAARGRCGSTVLPPPGRPRPGPP